jgi:hypothetical protein
MAPRSTDVDTSLGFIAIPEPSAAPPPSDWLGSYRGACQSECLTNKKGCPCRQPFHCRAVVRRRPHDPECGSRKPRRETVTVTSRGVSSEPRLRRGSSSRMPATAAIDNETLDHLLSVVTGTFKVGQIRPLSKPAGTGGRVRLNLRYFAPRCASAARRQGRAPTRTANGRADRTVSARR